MRGFALLSTLLSTLPILAGLSVGGLFVGGLLMPETAQAQDAAPDTPLNAPLDTALTRVMRTRRAAESITVDRDAALVVTGLSVEGRRARRVQQITWGDLVITGPIDIAWQGYGRRRVVELSAPDLALRWRDIDLGHGPLALQRADTDWSGEWRSSGGIASARAIWSTDDSQLASLVVSLSDLRLDAVAEQWLKGTPFDSLNGRAQGELVVDLNGPAPTGTLSLHATPRMGDVALGELLIDARRAPSAAPVFTAIIKGPLGIIEAEGSFPSEDDAPFTYSPTAPLRFQSTLQAVDLETLTGIWPALSLKGRSYGSVAIEGTARRPRMQSSLLTAEMAWRGQGLGRVVLGLAYEDEEFIPTFNWDGHTTLNGRVPGRLDLDAEIAEWDHARPLNLELIAKGLTPARLRPFWRAHPAADFSLDLTLKASNRLRDFAIRGALTGALSQRGTPPTPLRLDLTGTSAVQQIALQFGDSLLQGAWTLRAPLLAIRTGRAFWAQTRVEGQSKMRFPLERLAPYLPAGAFDPHGLLTGEVAVEGTLGDPQFAGEVHLTDGAITLTDLAQRLENLRGNGRIEAGTLTVTDLNAESGIGRLFGQASITLKATPDDAPADLPLWSDWRWGLAAQLQADRFPFIHDTLPNGTIKTAITLDALMQPGQTLIQAAMSETVLHMTNVRMPSAQAIPRHRAVRSVDWRGGLELAPSIFAGEGRLVVNAILHDPIYIEGDGVDMHLDGGLTIERQDDIATTKGGFTARPGGKFRLFDNEFIVDGGGLTMEGGDLRQIIEVESGNATLRDPDRPIAARPLEPIIELRAHSQVVDTAVDVAVVGPGRRPQLILESDPPLPEYRLLTLLITGRVDAVDERGGDVRRQVARLVSKFHNPSLSRQLYDRLGVDKLGLKFGSSVTNPILTVGKQIDRQLYLETVYHHDAPQGENEKEVRVEYRLNPRWTLDTVYGDAAKGSLGVFWKTSFGRRLPPRRRVRKGAKPAAE